VYPDVSQAYGHSEFTFEQIFTPSTYWDKLDQIPLTLVRPDLEVLTLPSPDRQPLFYVGIYAAIGFGAVIVTTINTIVQYHGAIQASKLLFTRLLTQLVYGTMRWHDVTPTGMPSMASKQKLIKHAGRILNRLSRDMEVLDSSLSNSLRAVMFRLATFIASILTVTYVFPAFLFPATVISYLYYRISKGYINAGRDMRRMQSTTRSPIFTAFAESLEGLVTVRAFGAERRFLSILLRKVDLTTKV
jgi:ABC-type multidrug transport system fused ATPase/permease subunit